MFTISNLYRDIEERDFQALGTAYANAWSWNLCSKNNKKSMFTLGIRREVR